MVSAFAEHVKVVSILNGYNVLAWFDFLKHVIHCLHVSDHMLDMCLILIDAVYKTLDY